MTYPIQTPAIFLALRAGDPEAVRREMGSPPILPAHQAVACFEIALQKSNDALLAGLLSAPLEDQFKDHGAHSLLAKACSIKGIGQGKIKLLLAAGCQQMAEGENSPLLRALRSGNYQAAQAFIDAGGYTPALHEKEFRVLLRIPKSHPDIALAKTQIDQFLTMGFDLNAKDEHGGSRVMTAVLQSGNREIIRHAIERGGNPCGVEEKNLYQGEDDLAFARALWEAQLLSHDAPKAHSGSAKRRM